MGSQDQVPASPKDGFATAACRDQEFSSPEALDSSILTEDELSDLEAWLVHQDSIEDCAPSRHLWLGNLSPRLSRQVRDAAHSLGVLACRACAQFHLRALTLLWCFRCCMVCFSNMAPSRMSSPSLAECMHLPTFKPQRMPPQQLPPSRASQSHPLLQRGSSL